MKKLLAALIVWSSCATYTPPPKEGYRAEHQPTFDPFRGEPLAVDVIDKASLFMRTPEIVEAAQKSVSAQLAKHGVTVDQNSSRRIVFELGKTERSTDDLSLVSCVRVSGRVQNAAQQFMPTREFVSTRCRDNGAAVGAPGAGASVLGAAIYAALVAVPVLLNAASNGTHPVALTEALSEGLSDVLSQIDAQASANRSL